MLAGYGAVSGYLFGFLLNLSFWPFSLDPNSSIAYLPGLPFTEQWHRYLPSTPPPPSAGTPAAPSPTSSPS